MSFNLRIEFWGWTLGRLLLSTFPLKVHSVPLLINIFFFRNRSVSYLRMRQLYSSMIIYLEIAYRNFPLIFRLLSRDCNSVVLMILCRLRLCADSDFVQTQSLSLHKISEIFSCREKLEHDTPNLNFCKIFFNPKSCFARCSKSNFQI